MGTSGGLGGETGHASGPRAGGRLLRPRREGVGCGVGWWSPEIVPQPSTHLGLCSDLRFPGSCLFSSHPSPGQGPALAMLLAKLPRASALANPQGPANPSKLGPHLGSGALLDPPAPLLQRQATSFGLPWLHSRSKAGPPSEGALRSAQDLHPFWLYHRPRTPRTALMLHKPSQALGWTHCCLLLEAQLTQC